MCSRHCPPPTPAATVPSVDERRERKNMHNECTASVVAEHLIADRKDVSLH